MPARHKYEVVEMIVSTGGAAGTLYLLIDSPAIGSLQFFDEATITAGHFTAKAGYEGLVFYAGEKSNLLWLSGSGSPCIGFLTYIDVEFP